MKELKMKVDALALLKCLLWSVCAFHIIVGAGLNLVPELAPFMANVYGATVDWTPEFVYIIKPLGAFMFVLGIGAAAAAMQPKKYRVVTYVFVALFVIRASQRFFLSDEIQNTFAIGASRNWLNIGFFVGLAVALVVLDRLVQKTPEVSTAA
jgi:hypothetical protein